MMNCLAASAWASSLLLRHPRTPKVLGIPRLSKANAWEPDNTGCARSGHGLGSRRPKKHSATTCRIIAAHGPEGNSRSGNGEIARGVKYAHPPPGIEYQQIVISADNNFRPGRESELEIFVVLCIA